MFLIIFLQKCCTVQKKPVLLKAWGVSLEDRKRLFLWVCFWAVQHIGKQR